MNAVLGIVGAAIAIAILSYFGIVLGGWIGYLISGFIGASPGRYNLPEDIEATPTEARHCLPQPKRVPPTRR